MKRKTPILFLVFNRLDTTKQVFEEIRKAKPKQLFIAADGPRNKEEKKKTDAVREYVLDNIDWRCEVSKLFRKENLGSKYAPSKAVDWFFENVEQGIILEDDCVPDTRFFWFCQELLERYRDDEKVISISGYNPLGNFNVLESYFFSKYPSGWGWATWKRSWKKLDLELKEYQKIRERKILKKYYPNFFERILIKKRINDCLNKNVFAWDIPWSVTHQMNNSFSIVPRVNLVENIGFLNLYSTHTKENKWDKKFLCHEAQKINFPLKHPEELKINKKFEQRCIRKNLSRVFLKKFFSKIKL
jgi:hypothetical protein